MEDSFTDYNQRIEYNLDDTVIREISRKTKGLANRFQRSDSGEWKPVNYPGYTIITPTFEDDIDNIRTYTRLGDVQQILLQRLDLFKYAPAPITSFHLTIADLIAGRSYENHVFGTKEQILQQVLFSRIIPPTPLNPILMKVRGVSLFTMGAIVALVAAIDKSGYDRLISFRDSIYDNGLLRDFGVERKFKFTGHITLAYIEGMLSERDQNWLAETLIDINKRFFTNSLQFNIKRAEVRKFDNMLRYYRQEAWKVFNFV